MVARLFCSRSTVRGSPSPRDGVAGRRTRSTAKNGWWRSVDYKRRREIKQESSVHEHHTRREISKVWVIWVTRLGQLAGTSWTLGHPVVSSGAHQAPWQQVYLGWIKAWLRATVLLGRTQRSHSS